MTVPTAIAGVTVTRSATPISLPAAVATDVANKNSCANDDRTFLRVTNTGASPYTLTFDYLMLVDAHTVAPYVVSFAAADDKLLGPFPTRLFGSSLVFAAQNTALKVVPITLGV